MILLPHSSAKSLIKAYLKQSLKREQIELFKVNLSRMFERVQKIFAAPDSPDVPQLEAEIDKLIYVLYGLTEKEIAVVEGKA